MRTSRIRYYESRALLPPAARVSGKRRYTEDVLRRLAMIDAAQRIGFSFDEIGDLLGSETVPLTNGCDSSRCSNYLRSTG